MARTSRVDSGHTDISVHSIDQFLGIGARSAVMANMTARGFDVRPMSLLPRDLVASVIRAGGFRHRESRGAKLGHASPVDKGRAGNACLTGNACMVEPLLD